MISKITASAVLIVVAVTLVAAAEQPLVKYCVDQQQEDKLRAMMSDSLDQAFREHFVHLFDVWVKDLTEEPERARTGSNNTISAWLRAQRALQNWKPQRC
jgi:hypothetical protein